MSHALPGSRCTKSWEGAWPGQLTQKDIPRHGTLCSVNELRRIGQELVVHAGGAGWAVGQWAVSNYIVQHLFFLGFISFSCSLSLSPSNYSCYHSYCYYPFISTIKVFLSQPTLFLISFPSHCGEIVGDE